MLTREIIQRVRQIQIRTGRQVADVLGGKYISAFKGTGVEFDEVRPYIPGDDVRMIDWNVTARTGSPFVKRYVEERQLTVMLMIDISASQDFGSASRSKREVTAELCALLAFSAIKNDDKVGLTLFHGGIEHYIPPRKGQKHVLRVIRQILAHGYDRTGFPNDTKGLKAIAWPWRKRSVIRSPRGATHIAGAMDFLMQSSTRKTVCFVVSDFFDENYNRSIRTANRKHDIIAVHIVDPHEQQIPDVGLITLTDPESGRNGLFDTGSKHFRKTFDELSRQRHERLEKTFRSGGIDFISINTTKPVVDPLVRFFRMRGQRMHR